MPNELHDIIVRQIELNGPMTVAAYMDLCLAHPQYGYYKNRDPLGKAGDFTTAPEISQLFGEMIGIWVADVWQKLGSPSKLILCELGAGRGTLMKDILRVVAKIPALQASVKVHVVEINDALIAIQKTALRHPRKGGGPDARLRGHDETCFWHDALETVPTDAPIIILGNEFLDALSFRQIVKGRDGWRERVIGLQEGKLVFGLGGAIQGADLPAAEEGAIFEFSPARESIWTQMTDRVRKQSGAVLMIDYGYDGPQTQNTFQAVKDHRFADPLENAGEQDLTSHVDFHKLQMLEPAASISTQANFLTRMGIEIRAEKLAALNPDKRDTIYSGLKRLTHRDQMGQLFKVIEFVYVPDL